MCVQAVSGLAILLVWAFFCNLSLDFGGPDYRNILLLYSLSRTSLSTCAAKMTLSTYCPVTITKLSMLVAQTQHSLVFLWSWRDS